MFEFTKAEDGSLSIREAVFQAIGAASMCWEPPPGNQVFNSSRALEIGEALLKVIDDKTVKIETLPGAENLGEVDDALYFKNKLFNALNFPKGFDGVK